jgi:hypothetical protein
VRTLSSRAWPDRPEWKELWRCSLDFSWGGTSIGLDGGVECCGGLFYGWFEGGIGERVLGGTSSILLTYEVFSRFHVELVIRRG